MSKEEGLVPIARITGVHGLKGEVKAAPYGALDGFEWGSVFLSGKGKTDERRVERAREHKGHYILVFEGCADRSTAETLVGFEISVKKEDLPKTGEDEYYYFDLIGMEVFSEDGLYIGTVRNVISTGGNDVLETHGPRGEVLIPAIEDVIVRVESGNRKIVVRLMEGLLPEEEPKH
ncbi:MAG TPA: ribosome maturation factor RimM [Thermodesulfobacteriota bacterium]